MRWENLTVPNFVAAVEKCEGVGIVPIGVIEAHGSHLPLGTDMFESHWTACRATEHEPALVFPAYPYGINHESAHLPGAIVFKRELVFALLQNVCDEMARQGVKKIILLSGHGGNRHFLPLFVQTLLEEARDYCVYYGTPYAQGADDVLETDETGHACEAETSTSLHINPELVRMADVPKEPFTALERNEPVSRAGAYSPMDWYARYPRMYVGDASKATAEKGKALAEARVEGLVELIRAVKNDEVTACLIGEFVQGRSEPKNPW